MMRICQCGKNLEPHNNVHCTWCLASAESKYKNFKLKGIGREHEIGIHILVEEDSQIFSKIKEQKKYRIEETVPAGFFNKNSVFGYLNDHSEIKRVHLDSAPNKELVVAYFNENINWINHIPYNINKITIYNKSDKDLNFLKNIDDRIDIAPLLNVGREAHTWLYHFITRRESLANTTFLAQGYPLEHSPDFFDLLELEYDKPTPLTKLYTIASLYSEPHPEHVPFSILDKIIKINDDLTVSLGNIEGQRNHHFKKHTKKSWSRVFNSSTPKSFYFGHGAMYALPKEYILGVSDNFYRYMIKSHLSAYQAEALWYSIFNHKKFGLDLKFNK